MRIIDHLNYRKLLPLKFSLPILFLLIAWEADTVQNLAAIGQITPASISGHNHNPEKILIGEGSNLPGSSQAEPHRAQSTPYEVKPAKHQSFQASVELIEIISTQALNTGVSLFIEESVLQHDMTEQMLRSMLTLFALIQRSNQEFDANQPVVTLRPYQDFRSVTVSRNTKKDDPAVTVMVREEVGKLGEIFYDMHVKINTSPLNEKITNDEFIFQFIQAFSQIITPNNTNQSTQSKWLEENYADIAELMQELITLCIVFAPTDVIPGPQLQEFDQGTREAVIAHIYDHVLPKYQNQPFITSIMLQLLAEVQNTPDNELEALLIKYLTTMRRVIQSDSLVTALQQVGLHVQPLMGDFSAQNVLIGWNLNGSAKSNVLIQ